MNQTPAPRLSTGDDHTALLIALVGQRITAIAAVPPLTATTDQGWTITIEGSVQLVLPQVPITVYNANDPDAVAALHQPLTEARLTHAALHEEGGLWLQLDDGTGVLVPSDAQYESWQVSGPQGQRLVCGPGGQLTYWGQERPEGIGSAEHTWRLARKRMAASVVFTDADNRVLLCDPTYKEVWEVPGGAVEANESPRAAAVREVREELGVALEVGRLLALDWMPPVAGRTEALVLVYDGGRLSDEQAAAIRLPSQELQGWAWCTAAQAGERLRPVVARRVAAALTARAEGTVAELEHGHPR